MSQKLCEATGTPPMVYLEINQETYLHRNFWPCTPTLQWEHKDLGSLRGQFPESVWFSIVNGRHVHILYLYIHIFFKENDTRTVDNVISGSCKYTFTLTHLQPFRKKRYYLHLFTFIYSTHPFHPVHPNPQQKRKASANDIRIIAILVHLQVSSVGTPQTRHSNGGRATSVDGFNPFEK